MKKRVDNGEAIIEHLWTNEPACSATTEVAIHDRKRSAHCLVDCLKELHVIIRLHDMMYS